MTPDLPADRLLPASPDARAVARRLLAEVEALPIVSPHGHCDARWWADDAPFTDPASLLVTPDHYLVRMLTSQGVPPSALGRADRSSGEPPAAPREVWRTFASHQHLFLGTPSQLWLEHALVSVLGVSSRLSAATADQTYDEICDRLAQPECRPRALFDRFGIELLATTESPLDDLVEHRALAASGWGGAVTTTFRADPVVDPDRPDFVPNLAALAAVTGHDTATWSGYLAALADRRLVFLAYGATATDHGHPSAATADLDPADAAKLFARVRSGDHTADEAELFRGQMLTEMVRMSLDDGLVVQLHAGSWRDHNPTMLRRFGSDVGADIPTRAEFVRALKPLLDRFGNETGATLVVYTLDETTYARELAPLAGHYPLVKLGAPWWFNDSPEGLRRFREQTTETAGFFNTAGFVDDTRAFLSIPGRHDVARRVDCSYLARLVVEHRLTEDDAATLAPVLAHHLAHTTFKVDDALGALAALRAETHVR